MQGMSAGVGCWAGRGRANDLIVEVDLVARTHACNLALKVSSDARVGLAAASWCSGDQGAEGGGDGAVRVLRERLAAVAVTCVVRFV